MRMTNKIMRNNSAYNINQNKILQDKLTNQMTTQSKIVRPSDDPVVAIRALRLRSNVTAVTQYNDRNAKDADQWLALTADAMDTVDQVLTDLYEKTTTAPNKNLTSSELRILMSQMKQLTSEFYSCANVDYAGRFVFSGYRTDLPVTYTEEDEKDMKEHPFSFNINESFDFHDISRISYTDYGTVSDMQNNIANTTVESYEQSVENSTMYRFRISYNNLDSLTDKDMEGNPQELTITLPEYKDTSKPPKVYNDVKVKITAAAAGPGADGGIATTVKVVSAVDPTTGEQLPNATNALPPTLAGPQVKEFADQEQAYKATANGFDGIAYIPSSGELVFSKEFYDTNFNEAIFNRSETGFQINYNKSSWKNGDINPVHYFKCTETKNMAAPGEAPKLRKTAYNTQREEGRDQDIYYDVGFNQQIQVNTRADEIFTHNVQRDMDDFDYYLKQLEDIETLQSDLEKKLQACEEGTAQYKDLELRLEGAKKAGAYIRDNIHTRFENQITNYQQYMDDSRVAMTDSATRRSRLELISTRLTNQKATFKELQQDNEGIDITEVAVELTASELTYNAALMATGKIMQTNLMNYI